MAGIVMGLVLVAEVDSAASQSAAPAASGESALPHYDLEHAATHVKLSSELAEISGLAFTPDGRLLAQGDEQGTIWQLDPSTGTPVKRYGLGRHGHLLRGDFEDIQVVGHRVFLVTSAGIIFEGQEGTDGQVLNAAQRTMGLGGSCEVEGMTWDPPSNSLLLLCKHIRTQRWRHDVVVLAVSPVSWRFEVQPRMVVPEHAFERVTGVKHFNGSAIVRHPRTGTFLLLAGPQQSYAEVNAAGVVLAGGKLPPGEHRQPEGIAIAPDLTLLISDEAAGRKATLTAYAYHR
jgi:hypothetical protein